MTSSKSPCLVQSLESCPNCSGDVLESGGEGLPGLQPADLALSSWLAHPHQHSSQLLSCVPISYHHHCLPFIHWGKLVRSPLIQFHVCIRMNGFFHTTLSMGHLHLKNRSSLLWFSGQENRKSEVDLPRAHYSLIIIIQVIYIFARKRRKERQRENWTNKRKKRGRKGKEKGRE